MNIVPFEGLDKRLRHSIRLGTVIGSCTYLQPHHPGKGSRFTGNICRTIITEPLDSLRDPVNRSKTGLYRFCYEVPDHSAADTSCGGNIAHNFTITTVHAESYPYSFTVPTGNLKGIRTPSHVAVDHPDSPLVNPHRSPGMSLLISVPLSVVWIATRIAGVLFPKKKQWIHSCYDKLASDLVFNNGRMIETGFTPVNSLETIFLSGK